MMTRSTSLFQWSWLNEGINSPTWSPNVDDNCYHIFFKIVIVEFLPIPLSQTHGVWVTKGTFNFGDDYYTLVLYYNYSCKPFHSFYYMDILTTIWYDLHYHVPWVFFAIIQRISFYWSIVSKQPCQSYPLHTHKHTQTHVKWERNFFHNQKYCIFL